MIRRRVASLGCLISLVAVSMTGQALAYNPFSHVDCSGPAANSTVCASRNDTADPVTGTHGILLEVSRIIAIIAGSAAVIIIIVSGLQLVTSGGDTAKVQKARQAIIYAAVGLVVIILAQSIIGLVIGHL